jgi:hypothetical protein
LNLFDSRRVGRGKCREYFPCVSGNSCHSRWHKTISLRRFGPIVGSRCHHSTYRLFSSWFPSILIRLSCFSMIEHVFADSARQGPRFRSKTYRRPFAALHNASEQISISSVAFFHRQLWLSSPLGQVGRVRLRKCKASFPAMSLPIARSSASHRPFLKNRSVVAPLCPPACQREDPYVRLWPTDVCSRIGR